MRQWILAVALSAPSVVIAQSAPYCVATDAGRMCSYYIVSSCQEDARRSNGVCISNPNENRAEVETHQPTIAPTYPDIAGSYQRGLESGQRMRIEREQERARSDEQPSTHGTVNYVCTGNDGRAYKTTVPAPGCVVRSVNRD